ncbi:MAG: VanZ family protein [Bacilli bacterium]|nr:VanZ family protein [Bacilli bacterium]
MKYMYLAVSLGMTAMVFSFSASTGSESASLSLTVATRLSIFIETLFPGTFVDIETFHTVLRKLAHVGEYFLLGVSWCLTFRSFEIRLIYVFLTGLVIAGLDEGIQLFFEDRGPSVIDALIYDFPGFVIGCLSTHYIIIYKDKAKHLT